MQMRRRCCRKNIVDIFSMCNGDLSFAGVNIMDKIWKHMVKMVGVETLEEL